MSIFLDESKIDDFDINILLNEYFKNKFTLIKILRKDRFKTIIVKSKDNIIDHNLSINSENPLVFKILPMKKDNKLNYFQDFNNIKKQFSDIKSTPNILPLLAIENLKEPNNGIIVMRQYIKYTLNDIQYHLHCISEIEKKWICFQLLQGLNQIHSKYKCHGDIKPNNILITSN